MASFFKRLFSHTSAKATTPASPSPSDINALLYKRNTELSTKNKALSLLGDLYEISILTLSTKELAQKISQSVLSALNYESVSIYIYNEHADVLDGIGSSRSDRYHEQLRLLGLSLDNISITNASSYDFFNNIILKHQPILNEKFGFVLKNGILNDEAIALLAERAHLKSSIIYPLALDGRVIGMLLVSMNREYANLPDYEKEIITNIVNVVSIAIDKSLTYEELKTLNEKLRSLDKLKTEFLSLASHQLRSPLTAIKGYTSMLLEGSFGEVTPNQKEAIDRVFQSSSHLAKVVEDLLNVSKIEQGGLKYEMAPFDFEKVSHDLATDLSITAQKKGLELTFKSDGNPHIVMGDMEKIRQVVLNIIDNAIKYTEKGSITVEIKHDEKRKYDVLTVTDTGMGISAQEKEVLFQKFSRGEGGKTNTSGSGLGLYLAKQIAEAHGGHVGIDSPGAGKGSTFTIELKSVEEAHNG
jgi:signal transduction histidine kinase